MTVQYISRTMSGRDPASGVSAAICAYRSHGVSDAAGAFAREVVGAADPESPARAKALLFAASRLAGFGESVGLELEPSTLLDGAVIERFILCGTQGFSPATRRTLRSNLRALARTLQTHPPPGPTPLPRERAKPPYSDHEIGLFLAAASALSTQSRRVRATALICLGAGAGVIGSELRHVRGINVAERSGGLLVAIGGGRARSVPVLCRYQEPLRQAAAFAGGRYLLGGRAPDRKNLSGEITALFCDPGLPRLDTGRLRSTWLSEAAKAISLQAFMAAAGVCCSQRLGDIAFSLPALPEREIVALLGGSS